MEKLLSGKPVARSVIEEVMLSLSVSQSTPCMAIIKFGNDPASVYYFNNIRIQGSKLGLSIKEFDYPHSIQTGELLRVIHCLNNDPKVHGILIQKPLPSHIDDELISNAIITSKDIDGINPANLGKVFLSQNCFIPCTAAAVREIIIFYGIVTQSKHIVIIGRSPVVAKPLAGLFLQKNDTGNATVTICHSYSSDLISLIQSADILVAAIGKPLFVKSDMIKDGTICLDVGINLINDLNIGSRYVGDIDYKACFDKSGAITPVPGGVGSVTTSILFRNLCKATALQTDEQNY